jgi:hypothetical protein
MAAQLPGGATLGWFVFCIASSDFIKTTPPFGQRPVAPPLRKGGEFFISLTSYNLFNFKFLY